MKNYVTREKERGLYRRRISSGDAGEGTGLGKGQIVNSSQAVREKELESDLRVSVPNQADEEMTEFRPSRSDVRGDFPDGKSRLQLSEVKQLHRRMQNLEEDTETMKKEFFASVDECNQLLNEVSQKLYAVHKNLRIRTTGEMSAEGELVSGTDQGRTMRIGLLQVLSQGPNPSLVTRVHKADVFTLQDSTGEMYKFLNQ